jgi:multisubunit Na+/H+ antiporter MnhB subunit
MGIVERSLRLLETQQAGLGVWLAAVPVLVALVFVALERPKTLFGAQLRVSHRVVLVLGVGVIGAIVVMNTTYDTWYAHRCIDHRSDIPECYVGKAGSTR